LKDITVKIWPEITGYIPAVLSYPNVDNKSNRIFLDFSNCTHVDSSGLNILLIQLIKLTNAGGMQREWYADYFSSTQFLETLHNLNFFKILNYYSPNNSLFQSLFESKEPKAEQIVFKDQVKSYPIHLINYKEFANRRDALGPFKEWLYLELEAYYDRYDFILPQFISIVTEIAKNSADHTLENAFFGLDVRESKDNDTITIYFSIGDLGVGINQNIKNHLSDELRKRYEYWDLTQTYRVALSRGFTTKGDSKENKGLGMSLILDGSNGMALSLSVFDANSRGIMSNIESLVHSSLRKNFFNTGREVGFYYYGKLNAKKIA
jgi:hypothetical protein